MPISADQERELLNKYKLTSLYPTEWPHQDDDDDEEYSEDERTAKDISKRGSKYSKIDRHASLKSSITSRSAPGDAGVQKDEPDALGMAPSVSSELRKRGLPVEDNLALRNKFMLSSTSFSPAMYLSQVHQNATTEDLLRGLDFLSKSIEQKSASLKVLVESNFERFVRAKATIDTVYTEMRTQGIENTRVSQVPHAGSTSMRPHSRQTSKGQSHFRNTSGPFGSQAKAAILDKRKNALTKESEYGVQGIRAPLQEVAIKAEEVWGPALGGGEKAEALKAVQAALDQHREIFTLSGTVFEAIKKSDYDGVVSGFKKAKSHRDNAKKIASIAKENDMELGEQDSHQIIVTARMWYDVNQQVDEFKQEVWRRLKNSHGKRPAPVTEETDKELHMELLSTLLQLGVEDNPIWIWINSHYLYLKDRIARSFERSRIEIEILRRRLAQDTNVDNAAFAKHLRSASTATGTVRLNKESARDLDRANIISFWEKVQASLSSLLSPQTGVVAEVLEWYHGAQDFVDNRAQKSFPTAVFATSFDHLTLEDEHIEAIRLAALDLIGLIRDNINSFFQDPPVEDISDLYSPIPPTPITPDPKTPLDPGAKRNFTFDPNNIPPPGPKRGEAWEKFAFWPPGANSLSGAHYLARFLALVGSAMGDISGLSVVRESNETERLKSLITNVRERLITAICSSWTTDSEKARVLESWARSPERRDLTLMPAYFEAWEEKVISNVQKIAYVSDAATGKNNAAEVILAPSAKLLQVVRGCFTTSLYKSLNGMVDNAEKMDPDADAVSKDVDPDGITVPQKREVDVQDAGALGTEPIDASDRNVRMLLTLSNLNHLRSEVIPQLISLFESSFSVKLTEESKTIRDVLAQIDARLFQSYVEPTIKTLQRTITEGIASKTWEPTSPRPVDARPYVYDVLISLVLVHAEVTSTTTTTLTGQILSYLLENCSLALIEAFKRRSHYSLPALMQATLDVEFMAQTLNNYTTDKAGEVQSQIYLALDERTDNDARAKLQGELPEMRGILKKLRESTKGEFGCFRRERRGRREGGATKG